MLRNEEPEALAPRVAVIGAGAVDICVRAGLWRLGVKSFTILEQSDGTGSIWWRTELSASVVDTVVPVYSFSFHPDDSSCTHVTQPELRLHIMNVADTYRLRPHIWIRAAVFRATWDETTHSYTVVTSDGSSQHIDVVASMVGFSGCPNHPVGPGLDKLVHNYNRSTLGRKLIRCGEGMALYSIPTRSIPRSSSKAAALK